VQLVSKISNLYDPDPSTLQIDGQTDRRTDDMQSQDRALHYSGSRGKNITKNVMNALLKGKRCDNIVIIAHRCNVVRKVSEKLELLSKRVHMKFTYPVS